MGIARTFVALLLMASLAAPAAQQILPLVPRTDDVGAEALQGVTFTSAARTPDGPGDAAGSDTSDPKEAAVAVLPGATHVFGAPDVVDGECDGDLLGFCSYFDIVPLRAVSMTGPPGGSTATARVWQGYEFDVPETEVVGARKEVTVSMQVSGSTRMQGFLYVMGASNAVASLSMKLYDITDAPADPTLVWSEILRSYRLDTKLSAGVSGSVAVKVEGGAPYIGVGGGGSIGGSIGMSPEFRRLDVTVGLGSEMLVKRGHSYRLQLELSTFAQNRFIPNSQAIASFFAPNGIDGPVIPNPFDPNVDAGVLGQESSFLSFLQPFAGTIPELTARKKLADITSGFFDVGAGVIEPASIWDQSIAGILSPFGKFTNNEGDKLISSTTFFNEAFDEPPLSFDKLLMNSPFFNLGILPEKEDIPDPGVRVQEPIRIALQSDLAELDEMATNRRIEEVLQEAKRLTSFYLPETHGGMLGRVAAVVDDLILKSEAAGLGTNKARDFWDLAATSAAAGDYKRAFDNLRKSYHQMANPGGDS
ncbi:MAG: hypothetical protein ACYTG2_15470 [Planctomycetota bacterium]|jgi:hypothetical protein